MGSGSTMAIVVVVAIAAATGHLNIWMLWLLAFGLGTGEVWGYTGQGGTTRERAVQAIIRIVATMCAVAALGRGAGRRAASKTF